MKFMTKAITVSGIVIAALLSVGCVEDSSSESSSTSGGSTSSSNCGYTDLINASERRAANDCGIQVSSQFAAADSYYDTTLQICKAGDRASADQYYEQYKNQVSSARSVASGFDCGGTGGGGSFEDTTGDTYYQRCGGQFASICRGPGQRTESLCRRGENLLGRYSSLTRCQEDVAAAR